MDDTTKAIVLAAGLGVAAYVLYRYLGKVAAVAGGLVSGDNAVTRNQTNAAGTPTTAYVGAGVVGTVGATVNSASGGWLATLGEKLGGSAYDLTHSSSSSSSSTATPSAVDFGAAGGWDAAPASPIDWANGSGWDLVSAAHPSQPLGQVANL